MTLGAVLFDLDGTLVNTESASAAAMLRVLARDQGIAASDEERDFVTGHSWVEIYRLLQRNHPEMTWTRDQLIETVGAELEVVFATTGVPLMPGAQAAVARFAHVPRGIVTGSSRAEARASIASLGMQGAFDIVLAAEDVATSKPAPDGYLAAAQALGVQPAACLVVEDSRSGIAAGVAAGARVVAVRAGNVLNQDQSAAHAIVDTLDQMTLALVATLFD